LDKQQLIEWLLDGDVSIQYQVHRDLLNTERKDLQNQIATEGWGKKFLSKRHINKHWGRAFYQPKWTSTHYTLLDLRNINLSPDNEIVRETLNLILNTCRSDDGGLRLGPSTSSHSDVCVNGMFLNYASYFRTEEKELHSIVDSILDKRVADGGFNCMSTRRAVIHSSLHSTLSVLEGLTEFLRSGYTYHLKHIQSAKRSAEEFILMHRLYLSDRTGDVINKDFLKFTYPCRWKYDILRALDYFRYTGVQWDDRMQDAINIVHSKRNNDGTWNMQAAHPGLVHFEMEKPGKASRWNTLRAMRVLLAYVK
jgi:hypothetical protein